MSDDNKSWKDELFKGLQFLYTHSFPKKCANCGMIYDSAEDFLTKTRSLSKKSGLKQGIDDDDSAIVELFRNCPCGSTLLEFCRDRRDTSEEGIRRREKFGHMLDILKAKGFETDIARKELLKVMNGGESEILKNLGEDLTETKKGKSK